MLDYQIVKTNHQHIFDADWVMASSNHLALGVFIAGSYLNLCLSVWVYRLWNNTIYVKPSHK
jgi:hypothetical protein